MPPAERASGAEGPGEGRCEAAQPRPVPRKRIGYMRRVATLGRYVKVE